MSRTSEAVLAVIAADRKRVEATDRVYGVERCGAPMWLRKLRPHEHPDIIDGERQKRLQLEQLDTLAARFTA